jgi:hypothetical protein
MSWIKSAANVAATSAGIDPPLRRGGVRSLTAVDTDAIRGCADASALITLRAGITGYPRFWARRSGRAWCYLLDLRVGELGGLGGAPSGIGNGKLSGSFKGVFAPGLVTVIGRREAEEAQAD